MKKICFAVFAAMVLTAAFAEEFPPYLVMEGTKVTGHTGKVPANLVIPDGVTEIGYKAFSDCKSLASMTIPESVKTIGGSAFNGCSSLKSVTLMRSVKKIGYQAFKECGSLESVVIPRSVTIIDSAFEDCNIKAVQYDGTKTQWNAISGGAPYNTTIHCKDGDITR